MKTLMPAQKEMDEDPYKLVKALFTKGDPLGKGLPADISSKKNKGWFAEFGGVPDLPIDEEVISEEEVRVFAKYLSENTFLVQTHGM